VIALLGWSALVGTVVLVAGSRLDRVRAGCSAAVAVTAPAAVLVWLLANLPAVNRGEAVTAHLAWMPAFGIDLDLRLDGLAAVMVLLAAGIGVAVVIYGAAYFDPRDPATARLLGLLTLFGGAMVGLVLADNLLVLYGFWELTSVTSFLLIGDRHDRAEARDAALQALLVTGTGGLAMLTGFLLLGHEAGTYSLSAIVADPPTGATVGVALVLVLLGAFTKSAQYPFHAWLPAAMVAPTPVSAYLHAATMVKAGVYLVARLAPAYADLVAWWRPVVLTVGLTTMVVAGARAFRRQDLKVLLAHGTVSQLGFLVAVFGIGTPEAVSAGAVMLLAHGLFKASAFFAVGIVDHQFGTRHVDELPRLPLLRDRGASGWLVSDRLAVAASASMAGIPLLLGFIAKEGAIRAVVHDAPAALAAVAVGSILTAGYSYRFAWGILGRDATRPVAVDPARVPPSLVLVLPLLVLGLLTVVGGVWPASLDQLTNSHLSLWHGFDTTLYVSAAVLAGGAVLFGHRRTLLGLGPPPVERTEGLRPALRRLDLVSERLTAVTQPGSLPVYAGVILLTAAVAPLWALSGGPGWPGLPPWVESPAHLVVAVAIGTAAVGAAASRRRFSAALFLGAVGYAMAGLFVVQGAPDLALTQVAMETLTTVLFVLVLRRLPDRFGWGGRGESTMSGRQRALRLAVAATVGASVFVLAITMAAPQPSTPVSDEMVARSLPDGGGRNVVNVILVDFRGLDTMGELTVLVSAAIGAVALARAGRRPGQATGAPPTVRVTRMVTFDVSVRILFAAVVMGSVYLLFAGHNEPGGGFVGGILAGAAVSLVYLSRGIVGVRALSRGRPWTVLGAGLLLSIATAAGPLLWGRAVLSAAYVKLHPPLLGTVKLSTVTAFDLGVYLVVLGLALMMFESFGDDPSPEVAS
jgi:multicomponent Na+:H+ antiporter subunit A